MSSTNDSSEHPPDRGPGLVSELLAPLRFPERVVAAIESMAVKLEDLRPMRAEVETIRERSSDLGELLPALDSMKTELAERLDRVQTVAERLEAVESELDARVGELCQEMGAMHGTVASLQNDVQRVTDRLPGSGRRPLEKAREVLAGTG